MTRVFDHLRLFGRSPAFLSALQDLFEIAISSAPIVIYGETGTGKELVGRAIHTVGSRSSGPFVAVNCGSLPDSLIEGELFGHDRGAFTDAHQSRLGLIAQADRGILFLDEIDTLSPKAQIVFLRFLQERRFRPLGASSERSLDLRVVAATNADLEARVVTGAFRADLYYRLCVLGIHLPPLRHRREDIVLLANHFLNQHAIDNSPPMLSVEATQAMLAHDWPGNVRQLENTILRACVVGRGRMLTAADLGLSPASLEESSDSGISTDPPTYQSKPFRVQKREVVEQFERDYLTRLIREHHGNVSSAARTAGKDRRELGKMLKKYQIDPKQFLHLPTLRVI